VHGAAVIAEGSAPVLGAIGVEATSVCLRFVKPGAAIRIVPTLRKKREEWGTRFMFSASDLKDGPPRHPLGLAYLLRRTRSERRISRFGRRSQLCGNDCVR
jgi:hypothetical protein